MPASVTRPEETALYLADRCAELEAENAKLRDQLRWRKWPDEKPEANGWYLCDHGRLKDGVDISTVYYETNKASWVFEINPKHWRPIGPLPGNGDETA
jgi:hypothetical protein